MNGALYRWNGNDLECFYKNMQDFREIDLSDYPLSHQQLILNSDGTVNTIFTGTVIDSYILPVKRGEIYSITANAGSNQVIAVGLKNSQLQLTDLPLVVQMTDASNDSFVYKDVKFIIPEGVNYLLVMSRNISSPKYNVIAPLKLKKLPFTTCITDNKLYNFRVYINQAPLGVYNDSEGNNPTDIADKIDSVNVVGGIMLPDNYSDNGTPCKAIMIMMGGRGYMNIGEWYPSEPTFMSTFIPYLLERGYAVFGCNGFKEISKNSAESLGLTNNLGLPDTIESYWKSYQYVVNNYNIDPKIYVWGGSQGGIALMNFVAYHPNVVSAAACMSPLLDLEITGWNETGQSGKDRIKNILGFNSYVYDNSKADAWNPMKRIVTIGDKDYYFGFPIPIKMCFGTNDEVLGGERMNPFKKMCKALINGGARCYCKWYSEFNHMDVAFGYKEIVRQDICNWFDRI